MVPRVLAAVAAGVLLAADGVKTDLEKMQGTWTVVALESEGRTAPAEDLKKSDLRLTIREDKFAYQAGNHTLVEGSIKIDPAKRPKTLDSRGTDAQGKAQETVGIYEIDGDTLRVCYVPAGRERPKEFKAGPKSGASVVVYRRVKS